MRIEELSSTHFRNLVSRSILFSPSVNLFVGKNGQGKTNVLEAIYLFKFGRSFRTKRDLDLIQFGKSFCRVEVTSCFENGEREKFSISIEEGGTKRAKISENLISRFSELVGRYPCVLFGPQDLQLVHGSPMERRRFVDMTGSMTEKNYLKLLKVYRRILNQRNAALKKGGSQKELRIWDEELITKGCTLTEKRMEIMEALKKHVQYHNTGISEPFDFNMSYESSFMDESMDAAGKQKAFAMKLASMGEEEIRKGTTMVGPHRDDVRFLVSGRDIKKFGSQGQKRLLSVLLKLAELSFLEAELGEPCVLLLDDVFAEFDETIGAKLKDLLGDGRQVFVTSPIPLEWESAHSVKTFHVAAGKATA